MVLVNFLVSAHISIIRGVKSFQINHKREFEPSAMISFFSYTSWNIFERWTLQSSSRQKNSIAEGEQIIAKTNQDKIARMAGLINVESFFSSLAGEKQLEIDFPHDQYFRKIGVYLRLALAGILLGYSFSTSVTCYPPGEYEIGLFDGQKKATFPLQCLVSFFRFAHNHAWQSISMYGRYLKLLKWVMLAYVDRIATKWRPMKWKKHST